MALGASWSAQAASLLTNGSFEDLNSTFVNDGGSGFMPLYAGSTAIPGWMVSSGVTNDIVWAGPGSGYPAADGSYYVELTGFGADSPNGAIRQTISVTTGVTYTVDLYWANENDTTIGVDVNGVNVPLNTPLGNGHIWTLLQGQFVGGADTTPYFEIYNASGGGFAAGVDAASITVSTSEPMPEPFSLASFGIAVCGLGWSAPVSQSRRG